jgi:hypothetical protein
MQSEENHDLTPADRELESALKSLAPSRSSNISPIDAAYAAGSRSARRQLHLWQSATAALLLVAIGGWLVPFGGRTSAPPPPTVVATAPDLTNVVMIASTAPTAAPLPAHSLFMLQQAVREHGTDGLPTTELPTIRDLRVADFF